MNGQKRSRLTIGEAAGLLHMSTSQIRFYERKGLLKPFSTGENGYRLYNYEQIERLEIIKGLRELNLSINDIAENLEGKGYDYKHLLEKSLQALSIEIEKLKKKQGIIGEKLKRYESVSGSPFEIRTYPGRELRIAADITDSSLSLKDIHSFVVTHGLEHIDYDVELFNLIDPERGEEVAIKAEIVKGEHSALQSRLLPAGDYFCLQTSVGPAVSIEDRIAEFKMEADGRDLQLQGPQILIEDLSMLLYSRDQTLYRIEQAVLCST